MAGFNRFGGGGLGSLYTGLNSLQQPSAANRRDDRFDNRRNSRDNFDRRERDFGRRDPSPRRRRYSPDPPYSGVRGNRQDNRGGLGSYSMDDLGRDNFTRNRGQSSSDRDLIRDGHNMRLPNRGDGILGAKPGDLPRDLTPNTSSGLTSQLAQQQQQLMAMVQTQSLLAAIQAQASAAAKRGGQGRQPQSLMQGSRMHDNRGRMGDRQNRKRRMSPPRGGQRNMNMINHRQRRSQQFRSSQGNRSNYQQRRDYDRDRKKISESSQKSEDNEPVEEPYVEETLDDEEEEEKEETKEEKTTSESKEATKSEADASEKSSKSEEPKPENQTKDSEFKSETNLAGQNVNNLVKSLYDTSRRKYVCKVCKIMCTKDSCFRQHLYGKRHVKTWLESRGQSFEAEMFKRASEEAAKSLVAKEQTKKPKEQEQEKLEQSSEEKQESNEQEQEESVEVKKDKESSIPASSSEEETTTKIKEEPNEVKKEKSPLPESKTPSETTKEDQKTSVKVKEEKIPVKEEKFEAKYSCDTRKVAIKEEEFITISSITEARVRLKGFDKGVNTKGCEFVKAVSGFNCRLCKLFIINGGDVMKHVDGKKHQAKYRRYISEHPKYESNQVVRNKELSEMLSEREGEEVLLYEVTETEEPKRPYRYSSGEALNVEVTKYLAVEDEHDDRLLDEQDESNDDLLREDMEVSASSEKKEEIEDDILNDKDEDERDVEPEELDENLLLGEEDSLDQSTLEEKYDPDLGKTVDEPMAEQIETKDTETKEVSNTSVDSLNESQEDEDEEPVVKKTKLISLAARRGRRAARGGAQQRGRGRGRGGKRTTRQKVTPKPEVVFSEEQHDDFMDGYEVIDEVADDE